MRHVLNESYRKIPELLQTALGSMEEETFKDQHKEGQQKESIQVEPQDEADSLLSNGEEEMSSHNEEKKLDNALESAGCGLFQVILTLVCGLALGSDTTEISCVSYIVPVAEGELHLDGVDKAVLNSTVFVGMIFGSMFWGSLADSIGRRKSLVISLLLNGISGFVSAFMPNLEGFAFFRFLSGIGVGGSLPVVISYFAEFFSTKRKGPYVVLLSMMWILFGVYAPLLGWALLHNPCIIDTHLGSMPFRAWRVYVLLCTIPALLSAVFFIVMPESPSWHYSGGRYLKAQAIVNCIAKINHMLPFCCKGIKNDQVQLLSLDEAEDNAFSCNSKDGPKTTSTNFKILHTIKEWRNGCNLWEKLKKVFRRLYCLFSRFYIRSTILLLITICMLSFGFYGLEIWFPVYFKNLLKNVTANGTSEECSVVGDNCTQLVSSCSEVYLDSLLVAACGVPGSILGIITINVIGGRVQITASMVLSGVSVFLIWWLPATEHIFLALSCLFGGISVVGWNGLNVLEVVHFATDVRSTAVGLLNSAARVAIIAANFLFGALQASNPNLPILIVAVSLFVGGLAPIFLPISYNPDQRSLLGKYCIKWKELCRRRQRKMHER